MARSGWEGVPVMPFTILVHLVGIACVTLVLVWTIHFRGGLAWSSSSNKSLIFNLHPVLMTLCFIFLSSEAIVHFKSSAGSKLYKKSVHAVMHVLAMIGAIVGVLAVFRFHNDLNIPNLYSSHAWMGLATILLFGLQWICGFLVYLFPGGRAQTRARILPWHVFLGLFIYVAVLASAETGIVEYVTLLQGRNLIGKFSVEAKLANCFGLALLLLGALVGLCAVISKPPSPPTKPEIALAIP